MHRFVLLGLGLGLALAGCGSHNGKTVDAATQDGPADTPASTFTLGSAAFAQGGTIPTLNTCSGANTSPPLTWIGAPNGTLSFAVVLTDLSLTPPLVHWVMYDIPASTTDIPPNVQNAYAPNDVAGAHQTVSVHAPLVGYYGPCPPAVHTYEFAVYALDVATLPGATAQTTRSEAVAAIQAHMLGNAKLTGTFAPP